MSCQYTLKNGKTCKNKAKSTQYRFCTRHLNIVTKNNLEIDEKRARIENERKQTDQRVDCAREKRREAVRNFLKLQKHNEPVHLLTQTEEECHRYDSDMEIEEHDMGICSICKSVSYVAKLNNNVVICVEDGCNPYPPWALDDRLLFLAPGEYPETRKQYNRQNTNQIKLALIKMFEKRKIKSGLTSVASRIVIPDLAKMVVGFVL